MEHQATGNPEPPCATCVQASRSYRSRKLLTIHTLLITIIVVATILRIVYCFVCNPLASLPSDAQRYYDNAFDVKGQQLSGIFDCPGFQYFLGILLFLSGPDRTFVAVAMATLSALTPWLWYRWLKELTRDKTTSLFGYAFFALLPSWILTFGFFLDSIILLPLTGAGLWLTRRAERKATWRACLTAAFVCGAACATSPLALLILLPPWLSVGYGLASRLSRTVSAKMVASCVAVILCCYGLGPFKIWTHTGAVVLLPGLVKTQRYFESGARDIQITSPYTRIGDGDYVDIHITGTPSLNRQPLSPFSSWTSSRHGRCLLDVDYRHGSDYAAPIEVKLSDRLRYTFENIIFFFFDYPLAESIVDAQTFLKGNLWQMERFIWFPLTMFVVGSIVCRRKGDFIDWYFVAVTLALLLQQSAVMEGSYRMLWEGLAVAACLNTAASGTFMKDGKK